MFTIKILAHLKYQGISIIVLKMAYVLSYCAVMHPKDADGIATSVAVLQIRRATEKI